MSAAGRRLSRRWVWVALLPALALAGLVVQALYPESQSPVVKEEPRPAARAVANAGAPLGERVEALKALVQKSSRADPVLDVLATLDPNDPQAPRLRVMVLNALARFPHNERAQRHLRANLAPGIEPAERVVAIGVLASLPNALAFRGEFEELSRDSDPRVRTKANWALGRLR